MAAVLAPELLAQVFGHFDTAGQLCVAGQVNRLWFRVSNDDSLWLKFCLNAGIEVPLDPNVLVRHVALLMVAAQQSLVQTPDTFLDVTALPFNNNLLWRLCRETLEAAGSSFPFDDNGLLLEVSAVSPRGVSRDTTRSSSVDSSRWSESSYAHSESSRGSSRGRSPHVSKRLPSVQQRSHCWKLLQLPLLLDFAPEIQLTLPSGVPQLRLLYTSHATLYRGFWDVYPRIKHLSRRLEKWLFRHLPEAFASLTFPGMGWRSVQGCSPAIKKRRIQLTDETARRRLSQKSVYLQISTTEGALSGSSGSSQMHVDVRGGRWDGVDPGIEGWSREGDPSTSASHSTFPSPTSVQLTSPNETTPISDTSEITMSPSREVQSDILAQRLDYFVPLSRDASRPVLQIPSVVLVGDTKATSSAPVTQVLIGMHARSSSTNLNRSSETIDMDVVADENPASKRLRFAPDVQSSSDAHSVEMDPKISGRVLLDRDVDPESMTKQLGAPMTRSSEKVSEADDMFVDDRIETDPMTFEDGDSDSEVLTNVEEDESMEEATVETTTRSRAAHSRRHLKEKHWDDYPAAQRADSYEAFFDEKVWMFGKFQFMPNRASRSLKELVLFYHLFRDGQRHPGHSPFGLFGSYLCYDDYMSLQMRPSKKLRVEKLCDLGVLNFATCRRTGKSLSLVVSCSEYHRRNLLWRVIQMDDVSRTYQDHGNFGQFLYKYVTDLERGLYSIGASPQTAAREMVLGNEEWFELLSIGSKIQRAIKQRRALLSAPGRFMNEKTAGVLQQELKSLHWLLDRLPPPMPTPRYPSSSIPINTLSMFPNFCNGSGFANTNGIEVTSSTLSSLEGSDSTKKAYRLRLRFMYDSFDHEGRLTGSGTLKLKQAYSDLMSPEYKGTATSPLIDLSALEALVMNSANRLIDKSSHCHPFPQSRHPFMMTIPTAAAEALGMAVETSAPSVALQSTWELLVFLADMMSTFILQTPIPATQCQLVSRHWNIRYKSGATQVVEGEGVVGQFPIFNVNTPFFEYSSYCPDEIDDPCVWMEGKFTFVPGSIQSPTGPPFDVVVPRFVFPTSLEYDEVPPM